MSLQTFNELFRPPLRDDYSEMSSCPRLCFIIDDDIDDQQIFCEALRCIDQECECIVANDCLRGIEMLEQLATPPDMIFIDLNMPRIGGIECTTRIRKQALMSDVPIVIFSGALPSRVIAEARLAGASEYFIKPSTMTDLTQVLKQLFHKYRK